MASGAPAEPAVRVLVVDDHEVVRVGLAALFTGAGLDVVGAAATAEEAVREAIRLAPDVAVVDVRLPDGSGVQVCRDLRAGCPGTRVIMLTAFSDDEALFAAIVAGASGYLLKQTRGPDLVAAVRTVHAGKSLLDPAVTGQVLGRLRRPLAPSDPDGNEPLTDLECRIASLMAQGRTNRQIAAAVFLSDKTVKHYVSGILRKLGAGRRSQAAARWARLQAHRATGAGPG